MANRPLRLDLFGYYYLGIKPDGTYQFPNINQVAQYFGASVESVQEWLEEYDLSPAVVSKRQVEISRYALDIQMELGNLTHSEIRERIEKVLLKVDRAPEGRKPWVDGPIP